MSFFGKTVSDEEWLKAVRPFYVAARTFVRVVNDAVTEANTVREDVASWHKAQGGREKGQKEQRAGVPLEIVDHEEQARRVANACTSLASVAKTISELPSPSSAEGRRARNSLVRALRLYARCARRTSKLLHDLGGTFGRKYAGGRLYETKWVGMETASLKRIAEDAGKSLETAAGFVDGGGASATLRAAR